MNVKAKKYEAYTLKNYKKIPQIKYLSQEQIFAIEVVGRVLPFKTNNYVVDELINWENVPNDPIFILNFPQKEMLKAEHFNKMAELIKNEADKNEITKAANEIRLELNPHPAGQLAYNVPYLDDIKLSGMQHKYDETVLYFTSQGQTCHAYCTFCFRWPQFTGLEELKFAMKEGQLLAQYVKKHTEVTDILFTGGDPLVMSAAKLGKYICEILKADIPNLCTIRIGTKALTYWPYKFLTDPDSQELLSLFKKVYDKGIHIAIMGHFNHFQELSTDIVKMAIRKIRKTGAQIRTQSPLLSKINDDSDVWYQMWKEQVRLGCFPYYMFIERNTGAHHYFKVPLVRALDIFDNAYNHLSGLVRTVRGPSMSAEPGKVCVEGASEINGEKFFVLKFLQARDPNWVGKPFFAKFNENATWLNDLKPAFGKDKFFFEE